MAPRISARDFEHLYRHNPEQLIALDIRAAKDYAHIKLPQSINIPFDAELLNDETCQLDALNVAQLEQQLTGRIVVCICNVHDNAVQVRILFYEIMN